MITLARLILDRAAAGLPPSSADLDAIPPVQWAVYWTDLAPLCSSRIEPSRGKQRNALRIEVLPSDEWRCSRQSPDGRGLAWLLSGGDPLAYGACRERMCPRREMGP